MESETSEEKKLKQCPNCNTFVQKDYTICPACGYNFSTSKSETRFPRKTEERLQEERPRNIRILIILSFIFASYMLLNGISAMIFLAGEGGVGGGIVLLIIGVIEIFLVLGTRKRLKIAYLAGLIVGIVEIGGLSLLFILYLLLVGTRTILVVLPIVGIIVMKGIIMFLLIHEKDYFAESVSKEEVKAKEEIPEVPEISRQAEPIEKVATTYLNSAKDAWYAAENAYENEASVEFILRADDAIQNLITGRYIQLFGPVKKDVPSTKAMIEAIRLRGYDLPEWDEFEKWRELREHVAKGVETPEESKVDKAYQFYQRSLEILGFD